MGGIMGAEALSEYMRGKTGGSASTVHIIGSTPKNTNAHCLGAYAKQSQMHAGRHVYQNGTDANLSLWWCTSGVDDDNGDEKPGSWWVGPTAVIGTRQGFFRATENTDIPEEVSVVWQVFMEGAMHDAPSVKVLTPQQHLAALQASLAGASRTLKLSGRSPEGLDAYSAFGFSRLVQAVSAASGAAELVNDRFTYRSEDATVALWFASAQGTWLIGSAADVGSRSGFLVCEDGALLPEMIAATWNMYDSGSWVEAPGLKVVAQEDAMAA